MKTLIRTIVILGLMAAIMYGINQYGETMMPDSMMRGELSIEQCEEVGDKIGKMLGQSLRCAEDSDCTIFNSACGLPTACGIAVHTGAIAGLDDLVFDYTDGLCDTKQECEPCPQYIKAPEARCVSGFCRID